MDIESHPTGACVYDYVEVDQGTFTWRFCGSILPLESVISSGPAMTLRFHSDYTGTKPGFLAKWEEIKGKKNDFFSFINCMMLVVVLPFVNSSTKVSLCPLLLSNYI